MPNGREKFRVHAPARRTESWGHHGSVFPESAADLRPRRKLGISNATRNCLAVVTSYPSRAGLFGRQDQLWFRGPLSHMGTQISPRRAPESCHNIGPRLPEESRADQDWVFGQRRIRSGNRPPWLNSPCAGKFPSWPVTIMAREVVPTRLTGVQICSERASTGSRGGVLNAERTAADGRVSQSRKKARWL